MLKSDLNSISATYNLLYWLPRVLHNVIQIHRWRMHHQQLLLFSSTCCFRVFSQTSAVSLFLQVSLKENGSLSKDSNVTMEIPTHTTIAYGLIELEIKHDGCYGEESSAKSTHLHMWPEQLILNLLNVWHVTCCVFLRAVSDVRHQRRFWSRRPGSGPTVWCVRSCSARLWKQPPSTR